RLRVHFQTYLGRGQETVVQACVWNEGGTADEAAARPVPAGFTLHGDEPAASVPWLHKPLEMSTVPLWNYPARKHATTVAYPRAIGSMFSREQPPRFIVIRQRAHFRDFASAVGTTRHRTVLQGECYAHRRSSTRANDNPLGKPREPRRRAASMFRQLSPG